MNMNQSTTANLTQIQPFSKVSLKVSDTSSVLSPGRGFIEAYDYSLNAYIGCSFGCSYCYVPTMGIYGPHRWEHGEWGAYVHLKNKAISIVKRNVPKLAGKSLFMSPVTDPYQPVERRAEITCGILKALIGSGVQLTVQTRAPLVTRDLDLLKELGARVNFSITTDDSEIKNRYEQICPSFQARLKAVKQLTDAGVIVAATCCPLLPLHDPVDFASRIKDAGVSWVVLQYPHTNKVGATTPRPILAQLQQHGWTEEEYHRIYGILVERFSPLPVYEEKVGFQPVVPHMNIQQ